MKLETPKNKNYAAVVVRLTNIIKLDNCDNVVSTTIFGFQAIIDKEHKEGDIGIVFPAETRLSEEYLYENNLNRHGDRNRDEAQKGYIEDNRRVKAVKFRGNRSDCLFMPLESLRYTGADVRDFNEGDTFDTLGKHLICEKYERPILVSKAQAQMEKVFRRVEAKFLPEHYDNEHYLRNVDRIPDNTKLIVTQKLHGTSIRVGHTICLRHHNLLEKILIKLGVKIQESEFDYVYGSRRVIKDINNPNQNHFYGEDVWTKAGKALQGLIPQNYLIYGELVGYTNEGSPIQKDYTYGCLPGANKLFVYRVAIVNAEGVITDLSWDQVKEFCAQRGLTTVKELWRGEKAGFKVEDFLDHRFADRKGSYTDEPVEIVHDDPLIVDEGVCVRVEGMVPMIYKAKSPIFLQHETKMLDQEVTDIEAEQPTL